MFWARVNRSLALNQCKGEYDLVSKISSDYKQLLAKARDLMIMQSVSSLVSWDMETVMPRGAVNQRSLQLELLSRINHKMSTNPEIGKLLESIQTQSAYQTLSLLEKRNVYLIKKAYDEQIQLPEKLVADLAKQQALTVNIWRKAKAKKNFSLFRPDLEKLLGLSKQAAEILMKVKETKSPYEAMIDNFEPKMTTQTISATFSKLLNGLKPLIEKIQENQTQPASGLLKQVVPVENQRQIAQLLTETLGYDTVSQTARGRIDETEHPFTSGNYDDVRITTHYYPNNYSSSIFSVLHESGHALYEQNINKKWKFQPVGSPCSFGIHESQSRFCENIIGRSREFWTNTLPKIKKIAPTLATVDLDQFIRAVNRVELSKIRIEADEVTYSLHVIVRFEIERDLFADKLTVKELPEVWNQKYNDYLKVKVENDSEGVMQDTHWASGLYGYFPSYTLGNIYSGQIEAAITKEKPNWRIQLSQGKLKEVNTWLNKNIHSQGDLYEPEELIEKATGKSLDSEMFLQYLRSKYGELYGF